MCQFCKEKAIKDYNEYYNAWAPNRYDENKDRPPACICYIKEKKEYHLWVESGDPFFSGIVLQIKYCPICGRELTNE